MSLIRYVCDMFVRVCVALFYVYECECAVVQVNLLRCNFVSSRYVLGAIWIRVYFNQVYASFIMNTLEFRCMIIVIY